MTGPYRLSDFPDRPVRYGHRHAWGPWVLDADRLCLCHVIEPGGAPEEGHYEIDLEEITNQFWVVHWLQHLSQKTWVTAEVLGHLTQAFIDLFSPAHRMRPAQIVASDPIPLLRLSIDRDWSGGVSGSELPA